MMTREDFLSLISQIDGGIETMERQGFFGPVLLLKNCRKALQDLYIEDLKLEARICGLRIPGLIITHTEESEKTLKETHLRFGAIMEELKSLGAA